MAINKGELGIPDTMVAVSKRKKIEKTVELEKIIDIKKNVIKGYEILFRIDEGNPYYYLKNAREKGETFEIFSKVLNTALSIIEREGCNIYINMEIEDLMNPKFRDFLNEIYYKYKDKINLGKLTIEVLEYSNYDNIDNGQSLEEKKELFINNLKFLKTKGFKLAVDDLSSGASTVERITEMLNNDIEVDIIKIDGKFLKNTYLLIKNIIETNEMGKNTSIKDIINKIEDSEIKDTIIEVRKLIKGFLDDGKDIVGEWLEIPEHIDFAEWFYGITLGQGYGFNKNNYEKDISGHHQIIGYN